MTTPRLTPNQKFFYRHAGYTLVDGMTDKQSKILRATQLEAAETTLMQAIIRGQAQALWQKVGPGKLCHNIEDAGKWFCAVVDRSGDTLGIIGYFDELNADKRRLFRAELALRYLDTLKGLI